MFLQVPSCSFTFLHVPSGSFSSIHIELSSGIPSSLLGWTSWSTPHCYYKIIPTSPMNDPYGKTQQVSLFRGNSHCLAAPYFPEKLCFIKRKSFHARLHTQWCKVLRKRMWASSFVAFKSETSEWASPCLSLVPYLNLLKEAREGT